MNKRNYNYIFHDIQDLTVTQVTEKVMDYYENIIKWMPGNVYWLDNNGITVGCNQNVLDMFGLKSLEDFKGLTFEEMGHLLNWEPAATKSFKKITMDVIHTGKASLSREEPPIKDINGKIIYFLTSRVPLLDNNGSVIGVIGISIDITERKNMEAQLIEANAKAEMSNKAKTEFLENMRHDIRTPLSGIVGAAELLRQEKDKDKIDTYINQIAASSQELAQFLNEILESIKVATGEIPLLKKRFDLKSMLEKVFRLHQAKAAEKHLVLKFDFDENIPKYLIGDPIRIYRLVLELLVNALKFTQEGAITITAKLNKKIDRDISIAIAVEDTGPGIPVDQQQELFIQFKRLTPSYQGIYKGNGLGLSIVKQFISDLEGEIYVKAEDNGSKFTCFLPFKESLVSDALESEAETYTIEDYSQNLIKFNNTNNKGLNKKMLNKTLVLLVEDHEMVANLTEVLLSDLNCQVELAADGKTAIGLAKKNKYDLIFMDIGLPDLSGYEVAKHIRLQEKIDGIYVPIIALTAHIDHESKKQCTDFGMNAILNKPLTKESASSILTTFIPKIISKVTPDIHQESIIDFAALNIVANNNKNLVHTVLSMFIDKLPQEVANLQTAYQKNDWKVLAAVVHKLNGAASYCGAKRFQKAAIDLEADLKTGFEKNIEKLYRNLLNEAIVLTNFWNELQVTENII